MFILRLNPLDETLKTLYEKQPTTDGKSGLDLFCPKNITIGPKSFNVPLRMRIKCEMTGVVCEEVHFPVAFMIVGRCAMSATPIRFSQGPVLIDANFRDEIIIHVDNVSCIPYIIKTGQKLFQIVTKDFTSPHLMVTDKFYYTFDK